MEALREKIISLIEPQVIALGLDLIEVNVSASRHSNRIEVLADRPGGGIDLDECAELNKIIVDILDQENIFGGQYDLEVSSPGIDRAFISPKDFLRARGKKVVCYLKEPVKGLLEHQGTVKRVEDESVYLENDDGDVILFFSNIQKAKQII